MVGLNDIYSRDGEERHPFKDGREEPSVTVIVPENQGASWRELGYAALALAIITGLFAYLADGAVLFTRPLWTDELHTALLASRGTPIGVIADLANGADYGPPLLHLGTWFLRVITGGTLTNVTLRVASMLCVWGALLLVYATLRRRFGVGASAAAVAAVASHSLVVAHSFEARFYGPWLLCSAYFAWSLSLAPGRRRDASIAIASVLLVSVHWYGVVSLGIMCMAVLAGFGKQWRAGVALVRPAVVGLVALALCVPLAIGQRHALTVNTWVPEFRMSQLESMARIYWTALVPMLALALFVIASLVQARRHDTRLPAIAGALDEPGIIALASLAAMPLALAAMSILGQPSMWPRYAIPAVFAWAPLVALALTLAGTRPTRAFAVVAIAVWFVSFSREVQYKTGFAAGVARQLAAIQQARALGVPIVFQSMHAMYAAASGDWDRRLASSFLELPDSTMDRVFPRGGRFESLNKNLRVERDVARVHSRRFGFPRLSSQPALDSVQRFVLVASDDNMPPGYSGVEGIVAAVFPHHRLARLAPGLLLLDKNPPAGK